MAGHNAGQRETKKAMRNTLLKCKTLRRPEIVGPDARLHSTVLLRTMLAMKETNTEHDLEGNWPGKQIDWESKIVTARIHVELPFWIAAPDGRILIKIGDCGLAIDYRNCIIGVYRNGWISGDERHMMQITSEGYPFSNQQKMELDAEGHFGDRHLRTFLTMPVRVHESVIGLFRSGDHNKVKDAQVYIRSLAHASIRFINEFVSAYRAASFDPFVAHVSHWDLPVWHFSDSDNNVWHVPMAVYPTADILPAADPAGRYRYRTTEGQIREAALTPLDTSTEELLDAWTCFYRGQFAEAIRKAVTAIEVAIADLVSGLTAFQQKRGEQDIQTHLAKMKFSEQFAFYLRETKRELPGPLTHIAPEVNGIYLERELQNARERRHKIVHESEKVDFEQPGPILRIMETMSWLHGWLREGARKTDPTESIWHSANLRMRDVFPLEPLMDYRGLGLVPPQLFSSTNSPKLLDQIHTEQLLASASKENLDIAFCVAWAFQMLRELLIDGRKRAEERRGLIERYWFRQASEKRPVFLVSTSKMLELADIEAIACRSLLLKRRIPDCGNPMIVVNHLSECEDRDRRQIPCVNQSNADLAGELGFTVISFLDWVAYACLLTKDSPRDFGFRQSICRKGFITFTPSGSVKVGFVRRVFPRLEVVSIVLDSGCLAVGDEICFRYANEAFTRTIETLEVKGTRFEIVLCETVVGVKVNLGAQEIRNDAIVYRLDRPRLSLDESVQTRIAFEEVDHSEFFRIMSDMPFFFNGFGTYRGDQDLGQ